MKLRQLEISCFRGIKSLVWNPAPGFNLLLGSGDAGKTTILDAIDLALGPRWNVAVTDADFTDCDTASPISIIATVGQLPSKLLGEPRFESHFRGWRDGTLHDEPFDDETGHDEPVLSIRFGADESLEPTWRAYTNREPEQGPAVLAKDREALGVVRVAHYVDRHLNWGRGSALTQYTDEIDNLTPIFADVRRHTRSEFKKRAFPKLSQAASELAAGASKLGVRLQNVLQPGLDLGALQTSASAVGLFDGDIPTRQLGLGSRRLLTITMQLGRTDESSLLLLDEIESALEPYRIRSLIRALLDSGIQVIATTHSPVVVRDSSGQSMAYARRAGKSCEVVLLDDEIKRKLIKHPSILLSQRALVCEGKTETGFLKAAKEKWRSKYSIDLDMLGIAEVYAEGRNECGGISKKMVKLGLPVCIYADSDEPISLSAQDKAHPLLTVVQYATQMKAEQALFLSLDQEGCELALAKVLELRSDLKNELASRFSPPENLDKLLGAPVDSSKTVQQHLAELADQFRWLRKEDVAEAVLGTVFFKLRGPLDDAMNALETWCYGADDS